MSLVKQLAGNGRLLLVLGLVAGIVFPDAGLALRPWLAAMVGGLLLLAALRVERFRAVGGLRGSVVFVLMAQLVVPLSIVSLAHLVGWSGPNVSGIVLLAAACTISGAPNLVVMCGHAPDHALRNLVLGVAILPLTIVPVLALWPPLAGSWNELAGATLRLLVVIVLAGGVALAVRQAFDMRSPNVVRATDAAANVLMAVLVVALMAAIPEAWIADRAGLAWTMCAAFGANFALQAFGYALWSGAGPAARVAAAIGMGNRNMALFLAALPAATLEPLLLFVACYQVPMYLTPIVFGPLYARRLEDDRREG